MTGGARWASRVEVDLLRLIGQCVLESDEGVSVLGAERDEDGSVRELRHLVANPAAERVAQVDGLAGRGLVEVFPDLERTLLPVLARLLETGGRLDEELRLETPRAPRLDGRWIAVRAGVVASDVVVVRYRDVTEVREAVTALAASERRFRSLVERATDVISVLDDRGVHRYVSPAIEATLGYAPGEVVGRHFREFVARDHRAVAEDAFAACVAGARERHLQLELRLVRRDGRELWVAGQVTNHLDDAAVDGVVVNWRDATDRREFQRALEQQALHDVLTGLPNRRLLTDHLELALARALRSGHAVAVLFCDLDHFKQVNDFYGHAAGDALLVDLAQRLRGAVRPGDTVARFAGDEFVMLCEDLQSPADVPALAARVQEAVSGEYLVAPATEVHTTVSLGIAVGDASATAERLLSEADAALYEAKRRGRARVEVFNDRLREAASRRVRTGAALRRCDPATSFELHYQPKLDLTRRRLVGAEALLRWRQPDGELVAPAAFLDVAEETGLIVDIGAWVIDTAFAQAAAWSHLPDPPLVHVNLSGRQLADGPQLLRHLEQALARTGVDPGLVQLEVTETVLLTDLAAVRRALERIKQLGLSIALDDFGTGYSSLSWLQRFPVDTIKLDRSFIAPLGTGDHSSAIVDGVIRLARGLGMSTVGEGVETEVQLAVLTALGCDEAQGYHVGRPMVAQALTGRLLAR